MRSASQLGMVVTLEYVDRMPPEPAAGLWRADLDPTAALRAGAVAMLGQVLQFGLFHADPHPGNAPLPPPPSAAADSTRGSADHRGTSG